MEPLSTPHDPPPGPRTVNGRDVGLALIRRLNGWLIIGAVTGAGALSVVAAHAFHGHSASAARHTTSGVGPAAISRGSSAGGASVPQPARSAGAGLTPPVQVPASASSAPAPVVSGGS